MPSSSGTYTGHPSGPATAPGYGRVAPSGGVPADAVPPAPAAAPASSGQYGLMPAPVTATRPEQSVAGAGPVPVAAPASSSTDRSAASSLNLNGAPVRLEWWERLGGFLLQFRAFRILMRVRMVLTWVSLLIVAATLAVSPVARTVLGAWIGCFWIVAVCFWLARGKTVSWGMSSGFFALSMPWAGAVGWLSFQVAAAAGVPVDHAASQVVIAGVVEELAKLAPICLVAVIAPGRVRRLLIQDWLVLGGACGAGFMAVEEVARRLTYVLGNTPGLQLSKAICPEDPEGIIECIHAHTFSLWPFSDAFPGPVTYAGHAIVTGLVAVSIGLARHLWWRARHHYPAFGVALRCAALGLPLGVLWVAIVDHMATNSRSFNISWTSDEPVIKAWGATKGEPPWPIIGTTSSMAGSGQGRGWLLLVMLVVAVLLDARVMRLGGYARTLAEPGGGPGAPQGTPGG
ncbi:PrsW family glutamic-type intramembrane protease, partial [Actinomyces sp. oral taxon 171]|uniref:PrsW family glutamic-type intramembrane protease n=1 Tax=Actinomyces sp. oral taxon 171 TaxID=706438 RepID=UPI000552249C